LFEAPFYVAIAFAIEPCRLIFRKDMGFFLCSFGFVENILEGKKGIEYKSVQEYWAVCA
jgi:hypothetical protein